jgi:phage shock protein C
MEKFFSIVRASGFRRGPERWLGGVCGGLAAKLNVDVAFVRIAFLLFALLPGPAFVLYLIAWVVLPDQRNMIPLQTMLERRSGGRY